MADCLLCRHSVPEEENVYSQKKTPGRYYVSDHAESVGGEESQFNV